jgi:uncharacterized membrane protein YbhN (UPF0104 family)
VKNVLKYAVSLLIAGGLMWYVFRDIDAEVLLAKLAEVRYGWVLLAAIIFLISYLTRAYRWKLLLQPLGYPHVTVLRTVTAVAIGYFANLLIPRLGEVTRCGVIKRLEDVPLTTGLGTVIAERLIDLATLLLVTLLLFVAEFDRLSEFLVRFADSKVDSAGQIALVLGGSLVLFILVVWGIWRIFGTRLKRSALFQKISGFGREVAGGLASIGRIENKAGFWVSTGLLWTCYFLMSYVVFFALPETEGLTPWAGVAVLVMGSFGMAAPVQGGFGTFHALVSGVLVLYGVSESDGVLFATLVHGLQTLSFIVFGAVAFVLASVLSPRKNPSDSPLDPAFQR